MRTFGRAATGILRYDPRVVTPQGEHFDRWWLILEYDSALLDDWRELAESEFNTRLSYPRWGPHLSIIAGEIPRRKGRWGHREGEQVEFEYIPHIETDGTFFWLPARCDEACSLREGLGLPRNPRKALHLTLGREKR